MMKEEYLHALWKERRLHPLDHKLTNGQHLNILHFGYHNETFEGPDFSFAGVSIDGVDQFGPVEMHIRSSDWYQHGHQSDPLYNDVILHVVLEHDKDVVINGKKVPTLELKDLIDPTQYFHYRNGHRYSSRISCSRLMHVVDKGTRAKWMVEQYRLRLNELRGRIDWSAGQTQNLFLLGIRAFGMGVNGEALTTAFSQLDYREFASLDRSELRNRLEFSGAHKSGTRPANNPLIRLEQFRVLMNELQKISLLDLWTERNELILLVNRQLKIEGLPTIGLIMWRCFLINAYIPFLFFLHDYSEKTIQGYLSNLKPETNRIVRFWSPIIKPKNAFESQAIIAAYKYSCSAKKCLSCTVGKVILQD